MLEEYFKEILKIVKNGEGREESYYSALQNLLNDWAKKNKKIFDITISPKKTEAGNPDFRISTDKESLVGYIEAKKITNDNLDSIEESEQLKKYLTAFPNLILTNFLEFRLYRNGEQIKSVQIGRPYLINKFKSLPPIEKEKEFFELLEQFSAFSIPVSKTAKQLAIELAERTRFLRDQIIFEEHKEEKEKGEQTLESFYHAFKKHLISSLTVQNFSDLFAQTITYGLFAARSRSDEKFNRRIAYEKIPQTIGILREVFRFISSQDLPQKMEPMIDDIAEVLAVADVKGIVEEFYKKGKGEDPIEHFYETFLTHFDPKTREARGVFYTPESVVKYIVTSVNKLIQSKFGKKEGFADFSVTVLDPASGTLTFPVETIKQAINICKEKYGEGSVRSLIKEHVLKDFYAFELMMAPYAVGHLKMGFILEENGYELTNDERFQLFLTNTLEFDKEKTEQLPGIFERKISEESNEALEVKEKVPIMVVVGNPPYSGISENKGEWILEKIEGYKQVNGQPLRERNPKWLQDDYVKFFRFAQWKIEQTGQGILGFITNHAWLDNPTFRGMRASLINTFDEIYILNLHGSLLKKEKTPQGGIDENVFDIKPGVAITICLKYKNSEENNILYTDLWGLRKNKYKWLETNDIESTKWQKISPSDPNYFFVPKKEKGWGTYKHFSKINEIFPVNSVGVITGRDEFVIDFDKEKLKTRIETFRDNEESDEFYKSVYKLSDKTTSGWSISNARQTLREEDNWENFLTKILYRPFDERWIYYHGSVIERVRENVMKHLLRNNLSLSLTKRHPAEDLYNDIFVSDKITEGHLLSGALGITYTFPLFLFNNEEEDITLFKKENQSKSKKTLNINETLFNKLQDTFTLKLNPEEIFYYIYAILYSNIYRQKYQEFLKIDFPRISFTKDYKIFLKLSELGKELTDLHLLKSSELDNQEVKYNGHGDDIIKKINFETAVPNAPPLRNPTSIPKIGLVEINASQNFRGISEEAWNYYIGGYQVLYKWLKDRKGHRLSAEDIKHYCRIVTAIQKTIELQKDIDKLYPKVEKNLLNSKI